MVPTSDNFFATLNSAVFSDGSFVYVPPGVRCPMELSTYFRINEKNTGQFERTLIIADKGAYVSYLEGCTAPMRDENQLHAAVVELVALDDAEIKYSTVQNWYPGDAEGKGGIYNFVTKRGDCRGERSKISWTQVETGSAITWKYPSCILRGDNSRGEFYSIAISNGRQQVDSGTKMLHLGKNTTSRIISKGIAAGKSNNTYRGLVTAHRKAKGARNFTNCDSLLIGDQCGAHTVPYIEAKNSSAVFEHEATTSKISEDMLFYCRQRGLSAEEATALVVNGFVKDVLQQLPMEFAVEAQKLISISLEGSRSAERRIACRRSTRRSRSSTPRARTTPSARAPAGGDCISEGSSSMPICASSQELEERGRAGGVRRQRILLTKPRGGRVPEGLMIVVGEQGEIDVDGRSLGPVYGDDKDTQEQGADCRDHLAFQLVIGRNERSADAGSQKSARRGRGQENPQRPRPRRRTRARCTPSWARTARASRRSPMCWPASPATR